jgi:HK97 gp10 family phage protein
MGKFVQIKIEGLAELNRALQALPGKLENRTLTSALYAGAKIIRDDAKERTPVDTGFLKNQIIMWRVKKSEHQYADQVQVGVRLKARFNKKTKSLRASDVTIRRRRLRNGQIVEKKYPAFYWRFLEFGTSKMQARPFLRPAFEAKKEQAANRIKERLRQTLDEIANKQ